MAKLEERDAQALSYLPEPPMEPLSSDCCGTGCSPCVMDIYQEELDTWKMLSAMTPEERAAWRREKMNTKTLTELKCALSTLEYRAFVVKAIEKVSEDSFIYTIALPAGKCLGYQIGQHCVLRGEDAKGGCFSRQYTPISPPDRQESFDVLIKVYDDGAMSRLVRAWREGTVTEWKGMFGGFNYTPNKYERLGMIACGTGIAPMMQIIRTIIENELDETLIHLLYCCRNQHSISLITQLQEYLSYWNFKVTYVLSKVSEADVKTDPGVIKYGDNVHFGRLDSQLVCKEIPKADLKNFVLICGTKSFDKDVINFLSRNGYTKEMYHKF